MLIICFELNSSIVWAGKVAIGHFTTAESIVYFAINAWCCKEGVLLELSPLFLFQPCRHTSAGMGALQIDNSLKCTYVA